MLDRETKYNIMGKSQLICRLAHNKEPISPELAIEVSQMLDRLLSEYNAFYGKGYSQKATQKALIDLWKVSNLNQEIINQLTEKHQILDELNECGENGIAGIGLGNPGGHAV